jgi:hypothetical protein
MYGALLELQTQTQINAYNIRQLRSAADAAALRAAAEEGMLLFSGMFSPSPARSLSRARSLSALAMSRACVSWLSWYFEIWHGAQMLGQGAVALKVKRERAHARERASERIIYSLTVGFRY